MRSAVVIIVTVLVVMMSVLVADARTAPPDPVAHAASVCGDYSNQAAAQAAGDTRDADGDGIYCVVSPR